MSPSFLLTKLSILPSLLSPLSTALFAPLPLPLRWRTLFLLPINLLAALLTSPSWLFNTRYTVLYIPTRSGPRRCLVYQPPRKNKTELRNDLRPLHIDIHGGGWIGGCPELGARWCSLLSSRTGAVVVSCSYRVAPRHTFPAAHNDIDDIVTSLLSSARSLGADPSLLTVGGSSVGGALALSASQYLSSQGGTKPLAWLGHYPFLDARLRPQEKVRPPGFPSHDPVAFLLPLFDVYGGAERAKYIRDARLHPILAPRKTLPARMLFVVAGIDILRHEQMSMVERLRGEEGAEGVEVMEVEKGFHGFLELPKFILEKERVEVFERSVRFIMDVYREHGYEMEGK